MRKLLEFDDDTLAKLKQLARDRMGPLQELADEATAELLRKILLMEEGHVDWAEQQSDQIEQMGLANYLNNQVAR